ncbi:hypothetical protein F4802DRAFT_611197 [Xylaria palmicola]|nr:hypothetical protein F4802DRAFT_611197 [Xylaria palmicola]
MDITLLYGAVLAIVIILAILISRKTHVDSITRLDFIFLFVFLSVNGIILGWSPHERDVISRRASRMALLNISPFFVGVPLSKYYFAHHWLGRVAAVEAFIHFGLSFYQAHDIQVRADKQAVHAIVRLRRPIKIYPGCYFYLYFPVAPFPLMIRGYPMNVAWWNTEDNLGSGYSSELTFLLYRQGAISDLVKSGSSLRKALLDGPYGRDLRLHEYENVILAAKGQGITAILPHVLHLASRRLYDKQRIKKSPFERPPYLDTTRKVDLFWVLEDNSQERWFHDELRTLQKLDPSNKLLCIWCIYPSPKQRAPPFYPNEYWRCFYPEPGSKFHQNGIAKEIGVGAISPGKSIVISMSNVQHYFTSHANLIVACGEPLFTGHIRDVVIQNTSTEYVEVEYRPTLPVQGSEGVPARARGEGTNLEAHTNDV